MLSMLPSYTGRREWRCSFIKESTFSCSHSELMAATSTRAVSTVSTVRSANCSAELISSPRSGSSVPSSVMSSMMS